MFNTFPVEIVILTFIVYLSPLPFTYVVVKHFYSELDIAFFCHKLICELAYACYKVRPLQLNINRFKFVVLCILKLMCHFWQ